MVRTMRNSIIFLNRTYHKINSHVFRILGSKVAGSYFVANGKHLLDFRNLQIKHSI